MLCLGDLDAIARGMAYIPPPKDGLRAFPKAVRVKPKSRRQRWEDDEYIYEWDYQHGAVEKRLRRHFQV